MAENMDLSPSAALMATSMMPQKIGAVPRERLQETHVDLCGILVEGPSAVPVAAHHRSLSK
jgi:hypothetical protein